MEEVIRDKDSFKVSENEEDLAFAKGEDTLSLEQRILKAYDQKELDFEKSRIDTLQSKDTYERDRRVAGYKADIKEREDKYLAKLAQLMICGGVTIACLCFIFAVFMMALSWFFPSLLPIEAIKAINSVVTFGFGVITTQIINKLLPNHI